VLPFGDDHSVQASEISCGDAFSLVLDESGRIWVFGKGTHGRLGVGNDENVGEPKLIQGVENIRTVSAGCRHSAAISEDGKLYVWGFNFYEQLGIGGSDRDVESPVEIPSKHFHGQEVEDVSCGFFHTSAIMRAHR